MGMEHDGEFMVACIVAVFAVLAVLVWHGSGGIGMTCNRDGTCDSENLVCVRKADPARFKCELKPEALK